MGNKVIIITGTPGTGKTTLAKLLEKKLKFKRLNLHHYYKKISTGYNKKKKCYNIDLKKFEKLVIKKAGENNLIIDSHISHLLPKKLVDACIVLVCTDLKILEKRLKKKKYSKKKIRENLDAEIFQICLQEAKGNGHDAFVFDTAKRMQPSNILSKATKYL